MQNKDDKNLRTIKTGASLPFINDNLCRGERHVLWIEWYESTRSLIRRKTDKGWVVQVEKSSKDIYDDGDIIFDNGSTHVEVKIKPCDTIVLNPRNIQETGKICFEIGNQHIPIFLNEQQEVMAAYDANLYNLLLSGEFIMHIDKKVLSPKQMVKAYGNFF